MTFRILTVCTGNICRSPLAERLLAELLRGTDVVVESAGVGALVGHPMPDQMLRQAAGLGIADAQSHRARQITEPFIRDAGLVLAMARDHRRAVVESVPAATSRTFTARELAFVVAEITDAELSDELAGSESADEALRRAVALAAATRGFVTAGIDPDELDVVDPYRRADDVYERSAQQLAPAVETIARYLIRATKTVRYVKDTLA